MIYPAYTLETKLLKDFRLIAGIDEVGRGPLAGPVVSAAVILDPGKIGKRRSKNKWWSSVRDSKTMSPPRRTAIAEFIKDNALDFAIGVATHQEIDDLNIHHASLLSMKRAIENLKVVPEMALVDGKFGIPLPNPPHKGEGNPSPFLPLDGEGKEGVKGIRQLAIVDGDAKVLSIAAASILAKVFRDDLMEKYAERFCDYGFEKHKGYDTAMHRIRLNEHGPCAIHRMTFETVKSAITKRFEKMLEY